MIRLYIDGSFDEQIVLSKVQQHYLAKVMRLREGDVLHIFNGKEGEWKAAFRGPLLTRLEQIRIQEPERDLWLLFSPLKPKRQAFLEEKATEVGVTCLWPIRCARTVVKAPNPAKMHAHVIEAAEQCRRLSLPVLKPMTTLAEMLANWPADRPLMFGDETLMSPEISTSADSILIGPEGGFTPEELALLRAHPQCQGITLSRNILRAETAAIVGLTKLLC